MVPFWPPLALGLLLALAIFPPTRVLSEALLLPALGMGVGLALLLKGSRWIGAGLLLSGLGEGFLALGSPLAYLAYGVAYPLLALGVYPLARKGRPGPTLLLVAPLALGLVWVGITSKGGLPFAFLDTALLLLTGFAGESALRGEGGTERLLLVSGLFLFGVADLAYLEVAGEGYALGHPVHALYVLAYGLAGWGGLGTLVPQRGALGGLAAAWTLLPPLAALAQAPLGFLLATYAGVLGNVGLLLAWERTRAVMEARTQRWIRFLEDLARLSPRVTQTLSPEAVLLGALEAARALLPQAVGLEVRSRRGLVGERTPHRLSIPLNGEAAYLYLRSLPEEPPPPGFLALLGERLRQVLKQVEWGALALTDPLTGLLNRRSLEAELPKLLALARRYEAPLSVAMLDIDRFKWVNDTYGHPVGDEVLKLLGRILQASVRREDLAVRYGGEEFLLFLYGADHLAAKEVVERIRYRFRHQRVDPIPYPLTLSAGIAGGEVPESQAQLEDWVLKADYALLRAKETGRDRVTMA
ncbi:GGDEF domain-containing protein [Thermus tenuipuniceus]|uniref:GGDEF domain-containing protein n=1 Tax=Thermus tenuipuniceus TaxID=2078690 RepID=UPI001FC99504|nr:GGDEF domain-containing protein [Thermus tenuipuniceus]